MIVSTWPWLSNLKVNKWQHPNAVNYVNWAFKCKTLRQNKPQKWVFIGCCKNLSISPLMDKCCTETFLSHLVDISLPLWWCQPVMASQGCRNSSIQVFSYDILLDVVVGHFFFLGQLWPWTWTVKVKIKCLANLDTHDPKGPVYWCEVWRHNEKCR